MNDENGIDLAYDAVGPAQGPVVVLLHGFPFNHAMWRHQSEALAKGGWRVIAPDLRGHGASPRPGRPASMASMAADVRRLLNTLGIDRFVLVGFSMGGYVALQMAHDSPHGIRGLALLDTRAEPDSDEARIKRYAQAEDVKTRGVEAIVDAMLPMLLTSRTRERRPELVADVRNLMMSTPQVGAIDALQGLAERPDQRPRLSAILVPTLVLVGDEDGVTPMASAEVLARGIPGARLEIIRGAAHLTPMEQPGPVTEALLAWLNALTPVAPRQSRTRSNRTP